MDVGFTSDIRGIFSRACGHTHTRSRERTRAHKILIQFNYQNHYKNKVLKLINGIDVICGQTPSPWAERSEMFMVEKKISKKGDGVRRLSSVFRKGRETGES